MPLMVDSEEFHVKIPKSRSLCSFSAFALRAGMPSFSSSHQSRLGLSLHFSHTQCAMTAVRMETRHKGTSPAASSEQSGDAPSGFILKLFQMVNGAGDDVIHVSFFQSRSLPLPPISKPSAARMSVFVLSLRVHAYSIPIVKECHFVFGPFCSFLPVLAFVTRDMICSLSPWTATCALSTGTLCTSSVTDGDDRL